MYKAQEVGAETAAPVLCVDLDGTLVRSDTLIEVFLSALRQRFWTLFKCPFWLLKGKARLKDELSKRSSLAVDWLPYNESFLAYLKEQKAAGRRLVLATASNRRVARQVADHLGIFDDVVASDERHNLRGETKAARLGEQFGQGGFVYAGNGAVDIPVWRAAAAAVVVAASASVARRVPGAVEASFPAAGRLAGNLVKAIRLYQWVKNSLVFVPVIAANALFVPAAFVNAAAAFVCFSLLASGVYLLNDLADLEADRLHPTKRRRPFASGELALEWGLLLGPLLIVTPLAINLAVDTGLTIVLAIYAVLTTAYSTLLKTKAITDVFTLAALYTLRLIAGAVATGYIPSVWLLSFSGLLFLALAFVKRVGEMTANPEGEAMVLERRGYQSGETVPLMIMGIASSFASAIVLALYVDTNVAAAIYSSPLAIWGMVPLCLFWQCRMWLCAARGELSDDPIVFAAKDRVFWATLVIAVGFYILALVKVPGLSLQP